MRELVVPLFVSVMGMYLIACLHEVSLMFFFLKGLAIILTLRSSHQIKVLLTLELFFTSNLLGPTHTLSLSFSRG